MVSPHPRILVPLLLALLAVALSAGRADAAGGRYAFDGGSAKQRAQVRAALGASAFDWSQLPGEITVHIQRGAVSRAVPGHVWLDADLLDAGTFAWAVVQEEFAHQVDFLLLDDRGRAALSQLLGTTSWSAGRQTASHGAHGSERFASALVWSYWPSRANAFGPAPVAAETFRAIVRGLLSA